MILIDDPYFNEPNVERMRGSAEGDAASKRYNVEVRLAVLRWAMLAQLRRPPPGEGSPHIQRHTTCPTVQGCPPPAFYAGIAHNCPHIQGHTTCPIVQGHTIYPIVQGCPPTAPLPAMSDASTCCLQASRPSSSATSASYAAASCAPCPSGWTRRRKWSPRCTGACSLRPRSYERSWGSCEKLKRELGKL